MHLVQDGAVAAGREEATGVVAGELANVGCFQRDVAFSGKRRPTQGRLARLARPGEGYDRELRRQVDQPGLKATWNYAT